MAEHPGVWGIDIGQCALKAIRLQNVDGNLTATAFDYVEHPKILSQPDADPDALTHEALEKFLSRNDLKGDQVAISVAGQSGLARFVKLPPVEEKKIADIVRFEAKQQIPFPLEEVVWDFQKLGAGIVTDGFAMETEIGLFAMKRDVINRILNYFQEVGVEVHFVQMSPLALCNYAAFDLLKRDADGTQTGEVDDDDDDDARGKKRCVVNLDIGTDSSNLVITDGGKIVWQRPIPLGGNHFTKALSKDLKLTFAKAEHVKRNAAKSPDLAKILKALKPVLTDFVSEVQRSLGYFTNTHRDAYVSYMVGLGSAFRLPGLQKFLAEKLSLDVKKPARFERLDGEATILENEVFKENLLTFPVAYGLALQGLQLARLKTNLLPPEITVDRKIRAKKPWAAAAAAMVMLGTSVMAFGYAAHYSSIADPEVGKAVKNGKAVLSRVDALNKDISAKESDVAQTQQDVKTIVAGQDERLNWIKLNEFINRQLPIPGTREEGGTLWERSQEQYWSTKEGRDAFEDFKRRVAGGLPIDAPVNTKLRSHLAMTDIDAVYCRYTDNLTTFFDTAKKFTKAEYGLELDGMLKEDREKAPEGGGWVVEIRGSTFHNKGRQFLTDTLLNNIARRERIFGEIAADDPRMAQIAADPIRNKVSHAFLLNVWEDKNPQGNNLTFATQSFLETLLSPQGGGTGGEGGSGFTGSQSMGGPMGMGPMGMGGEGFGGGAAEADPAAVAAAAIANWVPLAGGNNTGGGGIGMEGSGPMRGPMGGGGRPGMSRPPGAVGLPSAGGPMGGIRPGGFPMSGGPGLPGGGNTGGNTAVDPDAPIRFEFVLIFVWKEPTPSEPAAEATGSSTTP